MNKGHAQNLFSRNVAKNKTTIQKKFELMFEEKQTTMEEFMIKLYGGKKYAR